MNENMREIVELADCEWIQKRWINKYRDIYICTLSNFPDGCMARSFSGLEVCKKCKHKTLWLPVQFNTESGNWQIDDLLMEILDIKSSKVLRRYFYEKIERLDDTSFVLRNSGLPKLPDIFQHNDIILKLVWLRELIETENTK